MTRLLVLYGTTDGHTAKVARFLGDEIRASGVGVDVVEAGTADPNPDAYAGIIVAASVHAGRYQRDVIRWARAHAPALRGRNTAFMSVCLGMLQQGQKVLRDLTEIRIRFIAETEWAPAIYKLVAGAVLYTRYGWLKRMIMKRIVRKAGGGTDTRRDYEYTNWEDLRFFAADFCARCRPSPPEPPRFEPPRSLKRRTVELPL